MNGMPFRGGIKMDYDIEPSTFHFDFEHNLEKETFTNQCLYYIDCEIIPSSKLRLDVLCYDWEDAESLEEFAKSFSCNLLKEELQ